MLKRKAASGCRCELCHPRPLERLEDLAIVRAQNINGHGPFCGTGPWRCAQCEQLRDALVRGGERALREAVGCERLWSSDEATNEASRLATFYFTLIKPGRVQLWDAPVWMHDVAEIGDLVQARAEKEIYDQMPKPKGH